MAAPSWQAKIFLASLMTLICLAIRPEIAAANHDEVSHSHRSTINPEHSFCNCFYDELEGRLSIAGSADLYPLLNRLAFQFMRIYPDVHIAIEDVRLQAAIREFQFDLSFQRRGDKARAKGTQGASQVKILASSRPLTEEELLRFESYHGYLTLRIILAVDAIALYVNGENPLPYLTVSQLEKLFGNGSKPGNDSASTWQDLGVWGWENSSEQIHLIGDGTKHYAEAFFASSILSNRNFKKGIVLKQAGSASTVVAVAQDPSAIGYAGVGFDTTSVRVVPIAIEEGDQAILPTYENIVSDRYPLSQPIFLYINKVPDGELRPLAAAFLSFVHSKEGREIITRAGYVPMTAGQIDQNQKVLRSPVLP